MQGYFIPSEYTPILLWEKKKERIQTTHYEFLCLHTILFSQKLGQSIRHSEWKLTKHFASNYDKHVLEFSRNS